MSQRIEWTRSAQKDLARIDHQARERIRQAVYRLATDSYGDIKQLQGPRNEFRLRVGPYRVLYAYENMPDGYYISIIRVLPRDRAYRD